MNESKKERNLRMVNTLMGYGTVSLNVCYDEEDADFFDEILSSKLEDVPNVYAKILTKLIKDAPEEMRQMAVCELLEQMNVKIFG